MRSQIRAEIDGIQPLDALERLHIANTLAWIDSGAPLFRIQKPDIPPKHLISYFLLVDDDYVLLVDHINAELWLPTGGHVDPEEHPRTTVAREAFEELGIDAVFKQKSPILLTETETVGKTAGHIDVSIWYVLRGSRNQELVYDNTEFTSVHWFHRKDVPLERSDQHMERLLSKLYPD